jgi:hypothetical protein
MRGGLLLLTVYAALSLSACASDKAFTIAGRPPNPKAFEEDASSCSGVGRSIGNFFGGALTGAAAGAALGVQAASGQPEAAAVGAAAGGAVGLLIGAGVGIADSVSGDNYDVCMVKKGYQIAAAKPDAANQPGASNPPPLNAEAETAIASDADPEVAAQPVITRSTPPAPAPGSQWILADPER